jgi:hypothetical protein
MVARHELMVARDTTPAAQSQDMGRIRTRYGCEQVCCALRHDSCRWWPDKLLMVARDTAPAVQSEKLVWCVFGAIPCRMLACVHVAVMDRQSTTYRRACLVAGVMLCAICRWRQDNLAMFLRYHRTGLYNMPLIPGSSGYAGVLHSTHFKVSRGLSAPVTGSKRSISTVQAPQPPSPHPTLGPCAEQTSVV